MRRDQRSAGLMRCLAKSQAIFSVRLFVCCFAGMQCWAPIEVACAAEHDADAGSAAAISVNSVGFPVTSAKTATVTGNPAEFRVLNAVTGEVAFRGASSGHAAVQNQSIADFSSLSVPGRYYVEVGGVGKSPAFTIADNVFNRPFYRCFHAMYLSRCGTAVRSRQDGHEFKHEACHLRDGLLAYAKLGEEGVRDGIGGWHDAGDFNKYVVNGAFTAGILLTAWEHFQGRLEKLDLRIPESSNGMPDFLDEVRWELEWLIKMQLRDGRVLHKLSTLKFGGVALPENSNAERYFSPWSSAATADLVAVLAQAARVYRGYDGEFSVKCMDAAIKGYEVLDLHEENVVADLSAFSTGTYATKDDDDRLWAAAELWESTGNGAFLHDFEERLAARSEDGEPKAVVRPAWGWQQVGNLGIFTYLMSDREGRDQDLVGQLTEEAISTADKIVAICERHPYGRPLGNSYYWGCNGTVAIQTINLEVANRLRENSKYRHTQLHALSYLFGRNDFGRSFVTGIGHRPPEFPHDRRSMADELVPPWPGYLVGGPWPKPTDWRDEERDYRTNEIAINWTGAMIYALAAFVEQDTFKEDVKSIYELPK